MPITPSAHDCLVLVHISSQQVAATVAWRERDGSERVVAHKVILCDWYQLSERAKRHALFESISQACASANVQPLSVFVCMGDESVRANFAVGYTDLGQTMRLRREELSLALQRATEQPIGMDREVLHALPQRWEVRDQRGEREVDNPIGEHGSHLTCHVLLVTANKRIRAEMSELLTDSNVALEGVIATPVALYRGLTSSLRKKGTTIIIDCGARFTNILVHRKGRLVHLECYPFGGVHLTQILAEELLLDFPRSEQLKHELDISANLGTGKDLEGQTYLWREVQERDRLLAPAAEILRGVLLDFFRLRYQDLQERELLSRTGQINLVGRAGSLGGLASLLKEVFNMPVVLGTGKKDRDPSAELADLVTLGLVRTAAVERERRLLERNSSGVRQVRQAAFNLWAWLSKELD